MGFLVSKRNIEVDDLNTTITSLRERIKTVEALNDQLRPWAKSINIEIKDNFDPIQTNDNHVNVANEISTQKSAQLSSDLGFLVSKRNIEVDDLNTTITSLRERIKTVEALNDQLRPWAKSINIEIKDNFNPIQTNDNHVNVANQMSTQTSAHSFKDPSQVNRLTERLPDVGLYDNMTEQKGESKTKRKLIDGNKEWLGRLPLIETPTIRNLVKQPISHTRNGKIQNRAERQYRPNKANEQLQNNYFRNRFRNRPPQA